MMDSAQPCGNQLIRKRVIVFLALAILASRLPAVWFSPGETTLLFNGDELEMTLSTLDRFLGVPSTSLAWPGTTLQALALPWLLPDLLAGGRHGAGPEGVVGALAGLYREAWRGLDVLRGVVMVASSLGLALLWIPLIRLGRRPFPALAVLLLLATAPVLWLHAHMAVGDALAVGCACAALALLFRGKALMPSSILLAGLALGIGMGAKLPVLLLAPLLLGVALDRSTPPMKAILWLGLGTGLGFLLACPQVWSDPVRLAKSVLGNASRGGAAIGPAGAGIRLINATSLLLVVLGGWGAVGLCRARRWGVAGGALAVLLAILGATARAGVVYDRYFLPALPALGLLAAHGVAALETRSGGPRLRRWLIGLVVIACVCQARSYAGSVAHAWGRAYDVDALIRRIGRMGGEGRVAVPVSFLYPAARIASGASLSALADRVTGAATEQTVRAFAAGRGLPAAVATVLGGAFNEDEQALAARLRAMAYPPERPGVTLLLWGDEAQVRRFGLLPEAEIRRAWRAGELEAVILEGRHPWASEAGGKASDAYRLLVAGRD